MAVGSSTRPRARDLGIQIGTMAPGPLNAITDVRGVGVGHATLISGDGPLRAGEGPVRTGVTVIEPRDVPIWSDPVFAAPHRLNGNGEMTGLEWVRESGLLMSPIGLTNTHSVGVVRDALAMHEVSQRPPADIAWALPVVGETWDGVLNDVNGFHVKAEHVLDALNDVSRGPVEEGSVGGGTGMIAFGFKGGIGTSSRTVEPVPDPSGAGTTYTVGVLVQANFGRRMRFTVNGFPVGRFLGPDVIPIPGASASGQSKRSAPGAGSVIAIAATDAPLLPHQCARVAQRIGLGIGRVGGAGETSSGDLFLCFATGNRNLSGLEAAARGAADSRQTAMLDDDRLNDLFYAVIDATEEAVLNALLAAETMTGLGGAVAHALPAGDLVRVLTQGWHPLGQGAP